MVDVRNELKELRNLVISHGILQYWLQKIFLIFSTLICACIYCMVPDYCNLTCLPVLHCETDHRLRFFIMYSFSLVTARKVWVGILDSS
jgi:hypothetical protein